MLRRLRRHLVVVAVAGLSVAGCVTDEARPVDRVTVATAPEFRFADLRKTEFASAIFSATVLEVRKLSSQPSEIKARIDAVDWVSDDFAQPQYWPGPLGKGSLWQALLDDLGLAVRQLVPAPGVIFYLKRGGDRSTWGEETFVMPPIDYFQVGKRYCIAVKATVKGTFMSVVSQPF